MTWATLQTIFRIRRFQANLENQIRCCTEDHQSDMQYGLALVTCALPLCLERFMINLFRLFVFCCLMSATACVYADAFVCTGADGKRVFSAEPCEKKGMKTASKEFPVVSGQVMSAIVVAAPKPPDPTIPPGQIRMNRELRVGTPVVVFLLTMMIATGGLFGLLFFRFYKAHHGKLSISRTDMP